VLVFHRDEASCKIFSWMLQTGFPALGAFANFAAQFKTASEPEQKDQKLGPVDVGKPFAPAMFDDVLRSFSPDQPPRGRPRYLSSRLYAYLFLFALLFL
jgi:hypothetical protein